ncbi:FAD-dependent monooxygenase [Streptomyces hainanensis]|uniref:FAD-dependent monooxygenase n=1 Tax=Streptomyces hainanensis TaxID=402648 RepID=A0A4R4T6X3_9ACTN|nr:FAD-dependent monooxygenase [Streptomyces hainanensis]TDC72750.1 FAD-dependent monooxygenase [Streptomyces hainanensis]
MERARNALVVGGGVAGPVTALALRRAGIDATVYEAYPRSTEGVGGTLTMAPNGLAALELVGARDAVEAVSQPIPWTAMSFGRHSFEIPQLADMPPQRQILRDDLHRVLDETAAAHGVRVERGRRLVGVEEGADGVTARFADGSTATGDVLVGADGVHSTVRGLIDPAAPGPDYTGVLGFEVLVDRPVSGEPGVLHFAFGRRAFHLYWKTLDGRTRWAANLPHAEPLRLTDARAVPAEEWLAVLRETYGDDDPAADLLRHVDADRLHVTGATHVMPSVPHWHRGRLVLVGDAVHAPSNSSGQGASLAIESGIELARCLRDLPDPGAAFAAYERARRPRVEGIAARARRINQAKAPGPLARAVMPLLMRVLVKVAMNPERNLGPTHRYRVAWEESAADVA